MKKMNENLSEIFDIEPLEIPSEPIKGEVVVVEEPKGSNIESDVNFARDNIKSLIKKSDTAIDELMRVANASEHPRAYEVVATLIKTMADLNNDLLDIHKKNKDLTGESSTVNNKTTIDKAVFVGSTADLVKMIKGNKE